MTSDFDAVVAKDPMARHSRGRHALEVECRHREDSQEAAVADENRTAAILRPELPG